MPLPLPPYEIECPAAVSSAIQVEVVNTGWVHNDWKRVVDDGRSGPIHMPLLVGVISHPDATILVDSGLGLATRQGSYPPFPLSLLGSHDIPAGMAMVERLAEPPAIVLMTHLHYDHVGGLLDLNAGEVWTTEADLSRYHGVGLGLSRALKTQVNWVPKRLEDGSSTRVLGRPALDVLGDGSTWYLSLPGHTPGAAAVLVQAEDGPWLFVGDTAWVDAHLDGARRPWLTRLAVDAEPRGAHESLQWVRQLRDECPALRVITGHEPSLADGARSTPP